MFAVKDDEEEDVDQMNSINLSMLDRNTQHGPRDVLAIFVFCILCCTINNLYSLLSNTQYFIRTASNCLSLFIRNKFVFLLCFGRVAFTSNLIFNRFI